MHILNKTIVTTISIALLTACGGGGSTPVTSTGGANNGKLPTVDVTYTLNGTTRPTCHNADDIGELKPKDNGTILCIWLCGRYDNASPIEVSLAFEKNEPTSEGVWELEDESLTESSSTFCRDATKI